ncbi:unnamed protein product [Leptosia nina]|uniref:RING-type domain-containing protein n=1 Tax=Leptosia nina TaxID=320188 RepID=A0AAV1JVE3_9NEOP
MSRKETLKKALGLTIYTWSSDDELTNAAELPFVQTTQPRPSVTNQVLNRSSYSTSTYAAGNMSRLERDMYWNMLLSGPSSFWGSASYDCAEMQQINPNCPVSQLQRLDAIKRISNLNKLRRKNDRARSTRSAQTSQNDANTSEATTSAGSAGQADNEQDQVFLPHSEENSNDNEESLAADPLINGRNLQMRPQTRAHSIAINNQMNASIQELRDENREENEAGPSQVEVPQTRHLRKRRLRSPAVRLADGVGLRKRSRRDNLIMNEQGHRGQTSTQSDANPTDAVIVVNDDDEENVPEQTLSRPVHNLHNEDDAEPNRPDPLLNQTNSEEADRQFQSQSDVQSAETSTTSRAQTQEEENEATVEDRTLPPRKRYRKQKVINDRCAALLKELNAKLLSILECPVCLEWMEPPITQCGRGHLVCRSCRSRLQACPLCRKEFSTVRNRAIEAVSELVRYPCRFGCGQERQLKSRAGHESNCHLRVYRCPSTACANRDPMQRAELSKHFETRHPLYVKRGRYLKLRVWLSRKESENYIAMVGNEMFNVRLVVDPRRCVVIYVTYIGPVAQARNFSYEVFLKGQNRNRKMVYSRETHRDIESYSLIAKRKDCFYLPIHHAVNFIRRRTEASQPTNLQLELSLVINSNDPSTPDDDEPSS